MGETDFFFSHPLLKKKILEEMKPSILVHKDGWMEGYVKPVKPSHMSWPVFKFSHPSPQDALWSMDWHSPIHPGCIVVTKLDNEGPGEGIFVLALVPEPSSQQALEDGAYGCH